MCVPIPVHIHTITVVKESVYQKLRLYEVSTLAMSHTSSKNEYRASGNGTAGTAMAVALFEVEKTALLGSFQIQTYTRTASSLGYPHHFIIASDLQCFCKASPKF